MDRLSSCYFCGTALDEPLQDYPLVAGDTGEHGAVVTLCPGCHHKLETVLDVVVGEGEDLPALEDADRAALEGASPAALTEPEEGEDAPDPIALGDGEPDDSEGTPGASDPDGVGGADGEPLADGTDAADGTDDDSTPSGEATTDDRDDDEPGDESPAADSVGSAAETGPDTDGPGGGTEPPAAGESHTAGGTDDAATAGDAGDAQAGTDPDREVTKTVSALEYNKVMRLLQNREFPVDRAEIETIATSAYDLSGSECAAVIDLAVDRGLVAERDGQLVRPDE